MLQCQGAWRKTRNQPNLPLALFYRYPVGTSTPPLKRGDKRPTKKQFYVSLRFRDIHFGPNCSSAEEREKRPRNEMAQHCVELLSRLADPLFPQYTGGDEKPRNGETPHYRGTPTCPVKRGRTKNQAPGKTYHSWVPTVTHSALLPLFKTGGTKKRGSRQPYILLS